MQRIRPATSQPGAQEAEVSRLMRLGAQEAAREQALLRGAGIQLTEAAPIPAEPCEVPGATGPRASGRG